MNLTNRQLIDTYLSLQWRRQNIVIPLGAEANQATGQSLKVAIGNVGRLAKNGDFIKQAASTTCLEYQFIEMPTHDIQVQLDQASKEQLISGKSNNLANFKFIDDLITERTSIGLPSEMLHTKILQAATKSRVDSAYKEDRYVRTGGGKTP